MTAPHIHLLLSWKPPNYSQTKQQHLPAQFTIQNLSYISMPSLPPFAPPLADTTPIRYITIRHPAYPDTEQPLLQLAAIDGGHDRRGLDHNFALVACGIVTGNNWQTGCLATKNGDQEFLAIDCEANDILLECTYYYLLSDHDSSCRSYFLLLYCRPKDHSLITNAS